jgi:Helix-turn-helix domain
MLRMTAGPDGPKKRKGRKSKPGGSKKGKPGDGEKASKPSGSGRGKGSGKAKAGGRKKPDGRQRANLIRAIDQPLRRRVIRVLLDADESRSPAEISKKLDIPLGSISYQVRILRQLGAAKEAGSRQVRGAIEHFYLTTIEGDPPIEALLEETREFDEEGA